MFIIVLGLVARVGRRDAPFFFYRVLSLTRELVSRMRADVPRVTTGAAPACHCKQHLASASALQRDASPWRAKSKRAPARERLRAQPRAS